MSDITDIMSAMGGIQFTTQAQKDAIDAQVATNGGRQRGGGGTPPIDTPLTFSVAPYDFTGKESYFAASPQTIMRETAFDASRHPSTGFISVAVELSLFNSATGNTRNLFSRWGNGAADSYIFTNINGILGFYYRDGSAAAQFPESSVTVASVFPNKMRGWLRAVLNATNAAVVLDGVTFASATTTFMYSSDGVTWTQMGSVRPANTAGIQAGTTLAAIGGGDMTGRIYRAVVKDAAGKLLYNADMRSRPNGSFANITETGTGAGVTPATWTTTGVYMQTMDRRVSPYPRFSVDNTWKAKGFQLLPDAATTNDGNNGSLWTKWPQAKFPERIAYAKSQGANVIKFACGGARDANSKYPAQDVLEGYIAQTCKLLRDNGLKFYLGMAGPDQIINSDGTGLATLGGAIAATLALWMKYGADMIVGVDLVNEIQFGRPTTWGPNGTNTAPTQQFMSDMVTWYKMVRTVAPDVPCSFSIYCGGKDMLRTYTMFDQQAALGMDFHDYHPYNGNNNLSGPPSAGEFPLAADMALLESRHTFIGAYLAGEIGFQRRNTTNDKTTWANGMIAQATRPKSFGWMLFGDYDYLSGTEVGDYGVRQDATLTASFAGAPTYTIS